MYYPPECTGQILSTSRALVKLMETEKLRISPKINLQLFPPTVNKAIKFANTYRHI